MRSLQFWVIGYCTKWRIQGQFCNISCALDKQSLHSRWNFISISTELHGHGDERWPMDVMSKTYFRGVGSTIPSISTFLGSEGVNVTCSMNLWNFYELTIHKGTMLGGKLALWIFSLWLGGSWTLHSSPTVAHFQTQLGKSNKTNKRFSHQWCVIIITVRIHSCTLCWLASFLALFFDLCLLSITFLHWFQRCPIFALLHFYLLDICSFSPVVFSPQKRRYNDCWVTQLHNLTTVFQKKFPSPTSLTKLQM